MTVFRDITLYIDGCLWKRCPVGFDSRDHQSTASIKVLKNRYLIFERRSKHNTRYDLVKIKKRAHWDTR